MGEGITGWTVWGVIVRESRPSGAALFACRNMAWLYQPQFHVLQCEPSSGRLRMEMGNPSRWDAMRAV